jgi:hypothetical protein
MHQSALDYIKLGWFVFPLHSVDKDGNCTCGKHACSDAGKHPRTQRGLKEASRDLDKIDLWFGADSPPSNIGIVTGEKSGITVIDIDIGEGKFGEESWAEAIKDHGEPDTLMAKTGSGGMHVIFKYNANLKTASNVHGQGVDCRNDGGYIVAPPSQHRSGGSYYWVNWGQELAHLPKHLSQRKETRGRPRKDDMYRSKYTLEQVERMLDCIPADDRDLWRNVGIILGREFKRVEAAWELYNKWSEKWEGKKGRNHDEKMHEAFHELSQLETDNPLTIGTIVKAAMDHGWSPKTGEVPICNFVFYAPSNNFIYRPTIDDWVAPAVDCAVSPLNVEGQIVKASDWLKENQLVTSKTCNPSIDDDYVKGFDCREGEIVESKGAALFNTYLKPTIELGVSNHAKPFVEHCERIFNKEGDADQFLDYMAHRVQLPWEKPRFALLIAGGQGNGKDTAVEFCCPAIGVWNVANIDPMALDSNFNEFMASTLIRISEAANLHEMSKWAFNERSKVLIAGSPDVVQINPKYGQKFTVKMHCGVIITTNHLASGLYIPPDDRRYDVIETATLSEMKLEDIDERRQYFEELWNWFRDGGDTHIAAYLHERNIENFSPDNGQRKTSAHATVVAGGLAGDGWLDDILNEMEYPQGVRVDEIVSRVVDENHHNVRQKLGNSLGRLGYVLFRNPDVKDGRWKINKKKVTVYVKSGTPPTYNPTEELKERF